MTTKPKNCWMIPASGTHGHVFGPYTLAHARKARKSHDRIVQGRGLSNGQRITAGEIQAKLQAGSMWDC